MLLTKEFDHTVSNHELSTTRNSAATYNPGEDSMLRQLTADTVITGSADSRILPAASSKSDSVLARLCAHMASTEAPK